MCLTSKIIQIYQPEIDSHINITVYELFVDFHDKPQLRDTLVLQFEQKLTEDKDMNMH